MTPWQIIQPDPARFEADPLGYGALAWHKWAMVQNMAGFDVDLSKGPTDHDLKSPVLWLLHGHAMAEAARVLVQGDPNLETMPENLRGVCHSQYFAVALMLVGYSLEISLKAMTIMRMGVEAYAAAEKKHLHHRLERLAEFIPGLTEKDVACLIVLSHYVRWAGRYPNPGAGKGANAEEIFTLSERHQITAKQLFQLSAKIMGYAQTIAGNRAGSP